MKLWATTKARWRHSVSTSPITLSARVQRCFPYFRWIRLALTENYIPDHVTKLGKGNASQLAVTKTDVQIWKKRVFTQVFGHYRHKVSCLRAVIVPRRMSLSFGYWNMLNSALWFKQARMNNTTGCCCGSTAPSTKGWGKTLCYKITSCSRKLSWHCDFSTSHVC